MTPRVVIRNSVESNYKNYSETKKFQLHNKWLSDTKISVMAFKLIYLEFKYDMMMSSYLTWSVVIINL